MTIDYSHPVNPADGMALQHYLIAGAPKCGTTTLAKTFADHPESVLSMPKEPNFFVTQKGFRDGGSIRAAAESGGLSRGTDYYHSLFAFSSITRAYGDASTAYMHCEETPALLRGLSPDVKIIMIVRRPIDRIYSHYLHDRRKTGRENEPFEHIVRDQTDDFQRYVWNTLYARHIRNFLQYIPAKQIRVIEYSHLFRNYRAIVTDLFQFVGVDASVDISERPGKQNKAANPRSMLLASLFFKISRSGIGERFPVLRSGPLRKLKSSIFRANLGPLDTKLQFSDEIREQIHGHMEAELADLARLQEERPDMFIAPAGFAEDWSGV